jgi:endoglucanase
VKISESIDLPVSGGFTTWKTVMLKNVNLKQGINKIRVNFEGGNFNLNFLEFKKH